MSESSRITAGRILIAGCGFVGKALASSLAARGAQVIGVRRSAGSLPDGTPTITADLTDERSLDAVPADIHTVVYAASADGRSEATYRAAYVTGPQTLLRFLARRGDRVQRRILLSSTGVYSQLDGSWVDEDTPTQSRGTGALLEEGEAAWLSQSGSAVVLRLGGIYGPGRRRLIDRVLAGEAECPSGEPIYSNRIHVTDIVGAIEHLLTLHDPAPLYLGVDDEPAETGEVIRWLAQQTGAPAPRTGPAEPVRSNKRCRNRRLVEAGFRFRYPTFREGYSQVLEELGLLKTNN